MEELYKTVEETPEPVEAHITGTLPDWLDGTLYRNGPGRFEFGDTRCGHWFDGMAMVYRFRIKDGKVTYTSKFLRTDAYLKNKAANRIVVSGFGTVRHSDPCKNIFQRFFSHFSLGEMSDNTNVNIYPFGDALYAVTESSALRKVDPETLDISCKVDLRDYVAVNTATAHPHFEEDGTIYNLGSTKAGYAIIKMVPPPKGSKGFAEKVEVISTVAAHERTCPSYFHSFAMTEHYFVLVEQSLVLNVISLLTCSLRHKPFNKAFEWHSHKKCRIHIIDRKTGKLVNPKITYKSPPHACFHHANAFEEDGQVIVDLCAFDDGSEVNHLTMDVIQGSHAEDYFRKVPLSSLRRIHVPLSHEGIKDGATVECKVETIGSQQIEFPVINYKACNGKKYKYLYGCGKQKFILDSILKMDVETGETIIWHYEGCFPSEPVFVPHPQAEAEDHGVILSVVLTIGVNRHAFLLVLNAKDFQEMARATVQLKLGRDFHGIFVNSK